MKQIIPLKKDIVFKSKIGSLNDLNLDHDYKINDDIITGTIALSGTYKMTEASVVEDDFFYTIPFSIAISNRINKDTIQVEIDDFKYEIEKDVLKVKIDLELTCEENENMSEVDNIDNYLEDYFNDEKEEIDNQDNTIQNNINMNTEIQNITNNIISNNDNYYTYKVYIVRENDTIESICTKYNISYEELNEYNNLNEINIGDKIIIPSFND